METINKIGLVFFLIGLVQYQDAEGWQAALFALVEMVGLFMYLVPSEAHLTMRAADLCKTCGTKRYPNEDKCRVCGTSR